jgi:hypothetical protein
LPPFGEKAGRYPGQLVQTAAMKGRILRWCLAGLAWLPLAALGDGGFVSATAFERVQIPDQRALIHFTNGTETLVIDTAFRGEGTNFAWIIPVPSVPTVEPATAGLFTTLQILFQPEIVHDVFPAYRLVIVFGLLVAVVIWNVRRGGTDSTPRRQDASWDSESRTRVVGGLHSPNSDTQTSRQRTPKLLRLRAFASLR